MKHISFYPGPSEVYSQVPIYVQEAYERNILSINHRSDTFIEISYKAISFLKEKLNVPSDYTVFYASSATECWEIIAQSLIQQRSFHLYNGAFGKKWFQYTQKLKENAQLITGYAFDIQEDISIEEVQSQVWDTHEIICLTHNETSNGTAIPLQSMAKIRQAFPKHLIAVDATSSMAGIELPFAQADIWYASVQKCFGLPAGMAVMICSSRAIERALKINARQHYNSLAFMWDKIQDWQTTYTPNVLNIYLLMRVMEEAPPIGEVGQKISQRAQANYALFDQLEGFGLLIENSQVRSDTVIAVKGGVSSIEEIKKKALSQNIILGNGYGDWKNTSFRVANFPAIPNHNFALLEEFMLKNSS